MEKRIESDDIEFIRKSYQPSMAFYPVRAEPFAPKDKHSFFMILTLDDGQEPPNARTTDYVAYANFHPENYKIISDTLQIEIYGPPKKFISTPGDYGLVMAALLDYIINGKNNEHLVWILYFDTYPWRENKRRRKQ